MPQTASEFRTSMMQEFGLAEDNDNEGTSADAVLGYIDDANRAFINARAWIFRLKTKTQYIYPNATVDTQFTTAATQAELSSTDDWGTSGRVWIDGDIIRFTNNNTSTDTLTVTTADIGRTHEAGERAFLLYPVPSDYNKIAEMWVGDVPVYKEDIRGNKEPSVNRFWEVQVLETNGTTSRYFMFPYGTTTKKIYFRYSQAATDLTATPETSYIEVPEPYSDYITASVSARIYRHLEELTLAKEQEALAEKILREAKVFDSRQHHGITVPIRTRWDNPSAVLGYGSRYYDNRRI